MKALFVAALAAGVALAAVSPASARQGCGLGSHRGPYGHCRPNRGRGRPVVVERAPVVGVFYTGRGYWDGRRYWQHRYRGRGGWRYR